MKKYLLVVAALIIFLIPGTVYAFGDEDEGQFGVGGGWMKGIGDMSDYSSWYASVYYRWGDFMSEFAYSTDNMGGSKINVIMTGFDYIWQEDEEPFFVGGGLGLAHVNQSGWGSEFYYGPAVQLGYMQDNFLARVKFGLFFPDNYKFIMAGVGYMF